MNSFEPLPFSFVSLRSPVYMDGAERRTLGGVIHDCYNTINHWYYEFKKLPVAKKWIKAFDRALPEHQDISATKKIDFILWAGGERV